ncbi:fatty acid desaturase [Acidisoma sp.]|uniref:fatty acid desaturase n=1 Tax=Acidisoma sp. TaxID=1872115 RepID=UPI003B01001D
MSAAATRRPPVEVRDLKALSARSDRRGLLHLGGHLAAIGCVMALVLAVRDSGAVWPAMAVLGVLEVALFTPLHESTHRTPFRSLWLNRAVGWLAGFVLILPPEGFRLFHLAHHRHTQDPEHDPELIGAKPLTRRRYVWRLTGLPYWGSQIRGLVKTAAGHADAPWVPAASRQTVVREARIYLAIYVAVIALALAFRSVLPLVLWMVPVLLGQPVLRGVLMAEHTGCPENDDRMANTRTTLAGRVFGLLFWNANLHIEHHYAPGVPFHALPRLHSLLGPHLKSLDSSYPSAHRAILGSLPE